MQGNGAFPGGMYHRMGIVTELDLVFAGESANVHEPIWELLDQVISGPDGLSCFRGVAGLVAAAVVETSAGHVLGHLTMVAQFIFMTVSFFT